jgi:hypothetical protein
VSRDQPRASTALSEAPHGTPGNGRRALRILMAVATGSPATRVALEELLDALDRRALGFVPVLVALVDCVPLPSGLSTLAGAPVSLVGLQLLAGRHHNWLAGFLPRRAFRRNDLVRVLRAAAAYLDRLERLRRPRWPRLASILTPQLIGALVVLLENHGPTTLVGMPLTLQAMATSATLAVGTITLAFLTAARPMGLYRPPLPRIAPPPPSQSSTVAGATADSAQEPSSS